MKVLILFAHPAFHKSRINRELIAAVKDLPGVTVRDLYDEYPDMILCSSEEQKMLLEHDLIVFQHPFFWYSSPAILKEWMDLVLEYGFAYGEGGTALAGKRMMNAITCGGPAESYQASGMNRFTIRQFLAPFEQTAGLCGMEYLPPHVIHATPQIQDREEARRLATAYRTWIFAMASDQINWDNLRKLESVDAENIPQLVLPDQILK